MEYSGQAQTLLPRTSGVLRKHRWLWEDGYLVFGVALNDSHRVDKLAVLGYFNTVDSLTSLSSHSTSIPHLSPTTLKELNQGEARLILSYLLACEQRMNSPATVNHPVISELVDAFFAEMGAYAVYSNCSFTNSKSETAGITWVPVTDHAADIFLCAISHQHLGYWLYSDDE